MSDKHKKTDEEYAREFAQQLRETVTTVSTEIGKGLGTAAKEIGRSVQESVQEVRASSNSRKNTTKQAAQYTVPNRSSANKRYAYNYRYSYSTPIINPSATQTASIIGNVIGGAMFGVMSLFFAILTVVMAMPDTFLFGAVLFGVATAATGYGAYGCFHRMSEATRFKKYIDMLTTKGKCTVHEMSEQTGCSEGRVQKDLKKLLARKTIPQAVFDAETGTLYKNAEVQKQYEDERKRQEEEAQRNANRTEADDLLDIGNGFLVRLTQQETQIQEADVLEQTQIMRETTQRILNWLQQHPTRYQQVRRFCTYYLPTVDKLIATYNEVDPHADNNKVASDIQNNIVEGLRSVNEAFSKLEDDLLRNTAMDISGELSALDTMLAQDGLAEDADFASHIQ